MPISVTTEIWIQEPTGMVPDAYIWSCHNDRGVTPMDDISVRWGKDHVMDAPPAAVARWTFKDDTDYWVDRLRDRQVLGKNVVFYAKPSSGSDFFWFRGRITSVEIRPGPTDHKTGKPAYYFIDFTAADKTADFGQIVMPAGTNWGAETMIDRAVKIRNAAMSVTTIADFFFDPSTTGWPVGPYDASGKTIKELNDQFYRSDGYSWSYLSTENNVRHQRRTTAPTNSTGDANRLYVGPAMRVFVKPDGLTYTDATWGTITYPGLWMSSCEVAADHNQMYVSAGTAINRLDATYKPTPSYSATTIQFGSPDLLNEGLRLMTYDSFVSDSAHLGTATWQLYNQATQEGAEPQHPRIQYDTRHTNGFVDYDSAKALLEAGEKPTRLFLGGSPWTAWVNGGSTQDDPPVFKIQGGTIRFVRGQWKFDLILQTLAPVYGAATPLTWENVNTRLKWGEGAGTSTNMGFDESLSWIDSKFIGNYAPIFDTAGGFYS